MTIRSVPLAGLLALFAIVAPVAAQEAPPEPPTAEAEEQVAEETGDVAEEAEEAAEAVETVAGEVTEETAEAADEAAEEAAEAVPTHDWEFALAPTEAVPAATGVVKVTEGDGGNAFVVEASGLPTVDSLDQEGRDVNAYTVWVVPSKDKVLESSLAGILTLDPEGGEGRFEGSTDREMFGIVVSATPDGAPARITGTPVLTGIPVQATVPAEEAAEEAEEAGEAVEEAAEAAEAAGDAAEEATGEPTGEAAEPAEQPADPDEP